MNNREHLKSYVRFVIFITCEKLNLDYSKRSISFKTGEIRCYKLRGVKG